jgi:hypothetical protein
MTSIKCYGEVQFCSFGSLAVPGAAANFKFKVKLAVRCAYSYAADHGSGHTAKHWQLQFNLARFKSRFKPKLRLLIQQRDCDCQ